MRRALLTTALAAAMAICLASTASAFWTSSGTGSGSATTATMPDGPTPTGAVAGSTVTVSLNQVDFLGSPLGSIAGGGYEIQRYPASGGAAITPSGSCGSLVTGGGVSLSCTETSTPLGFWRYTVTPILYSWTGAESSVSAIQTVAPDAPATASSSLLPAANIALSWSAVPGVTGYNVYRRTNPGSYNFSSPLNGGTPVGGTSLNDTTSVSGTAYNYVVRAVFVDGTQIESADSPETTVLTADGTAPTATLGAIANPIRATVALTATSTDGGSGVANVQFQRSPAGAGTWTTICTDTTSAYDCSFNTTAAVDGLYDLRSFATDNAGNTTASTVQTSIRIDNTAPTATLGAIANPIRATVALTATSTDGGSGVANVQFQRSPAGAGTWTTICTDTTSAYDCSFNTTAAVDGLYDLRSFATDNAGNTTASTVQTSIRIDNTVPTATDIQTTNSGIAGRATTGDQVIYTFSEAMQPGTILAAWTGASTGVTVRLNNVGGGDQLFVYNAGNTVATNLGMVNTGNAGYVTANRRFTASTMVMAGSVVTVTLGTPSGATATVAANATLTWNPLAAMLDLAGNAMSTTARAETGAADQNF